MQNVQKRIQKFQTHNTFVKRRPNNNMGEISAMG